MLSQQVQPSWQGTLLQMRCLWCVTPSKSSQCPRVFNHKPIGWMNLQDTDNQENRQFAGNAAPAQPPSNIVTSWGPAKTNKRKQPEAPTRAGAG